MSRAAPEAMIYLGSYDSRCYEGPIIATLDTCDFGNVRLVGPRTLLGSHHMSTRIEIADVRVRIGISQGLRLRLSALH